MKLQSTPKYLKQLFILAAIVIGLSGSAQAQGTLTWNWTWSGTYSGSGALVTTDVTSAGYNGFSGYLITGITGTFDGQTITSLDPVGSFGSGSGDNLVSNSSPYLDYEGINFTAGLHNYNIIFYNTLYYVGLDLGGVGLGYDSGTFNATTATVPEPSMLALTALGGLSWFSFLRRRK